MSRIDSGSACNEKPKIEAKPDGLALFSVIKWPCFQLPMLNQASPRGPVFDDQMALFSVDKNSSLSGAKDLTSLPPCGKLAAVLPAHTNCPDICLQRRG